MCHRRLRAEHNLGLLIPFVPVCRSYRAPRTPKTVARTPWLELASADGPWRSRLHASTIIFGSMVLTDAVARSYLPQEEAAAACWTSCSHAVSFSGAKLTSGPANPKSLTSEAYCRAPCWLVKLPVWPNCN